MDEDMHWHWKHIGAATAVVLKHIAIRRAELERAAEVRGITPAAPSAPEPPEGVLATTDGERAAPLGALDSDVVVAPRRHG